MVKRDLKISLMDRSLYLKGLMLLIRKDKTIREEEEDMILSVGETLGFDRRFCADAIKELLHNRYVVDEPPRFEGQDVARCFVRDGFRLSRADGEVHGAEFVWLETVAQANGVDQWFQEDWCTVAHNGGRKKGLEARRFRW
jgi:hypothetical protein